MRVPQLREYLGLFLEIEQRCLVAFELLGENLDGELLSAAAAMPGEVDIGLSRLADRDGLFNDIIAKLVTFFHKHLPSCLRPCTIDPVSIPYSRSGTR